MRTITIRNFTWKVTGNNEIPCINDINSNNRTELTEYIKTMFKERYGCTAEVHEESPTMSTIQKIIYDVCQEIQGLQFNNNIDNEKWQIPYLTGKLGMLFDLELISQTKLNLLMGQISDNMIQNRS